VAILQNSQSLNQNSIKNRLKIINFIQISQNILLWEIFHIQAELNSAFHCKGTGKGEVNPRTGHEGP